MLESGHLGLNPVPSPNSTALELCHLSSLSLGFPHLSNEGDSSLK